MAPPPIQLFLTTIASQITLRQRQEYILRVLQVKKIEFTSYDLASDEEAKKLWRRKAPKDKQQLPGILVGGEFPGDFSQFEEAVEFNELDIFLRRNEDFKPFEDEKNLLRAEPIGVPGAYSPLQMYPNHAPSRSPSPSPLALREKEKKEINAGEELAEFGLANVSVSEDDLRALVEELGLGGDEADDLVKGLSGSSDAPAAKDKTPALKVQAEKSSAKEDPPKVLVMEDKKESTVAAEKSTTKENPPKVTVTEENEDEERKSKVAAQKGNEVASTETSTPKEDTEESNAVAEKESEAKPAPTETSAPKEEAKTA